MARKIIRNQIHGFASFIREQGVVALGVGLVLGVAVKDFVEKIVQAIIEPIINKLSGGGGVLANRSVSLAGMQFKTGLVVSALLDFLAVLAVVYLGLKALKLERLDKKKEEQAVEKDVRK